MLKHCLILERPRGAGTCKDLDNQRMPYPVRSYAPSFMDIVRLQPREYVRIVPSETVARKQLRLKPRHGGGFLQLDLNMGQFTQVIKTLQEVNF